jgi:hypothetical protein
LNYDEYDDLEQESKLLLEEDVDDFNAFEFEDSRVV